MDITALIENFLAYDDASTITDDISAILGCPVLVVSSVFKLVSCAHPADFADEVYMDTLRQGEMSYEFVSLMKKQPGAEHGSVFMNIPGSQYLRRYSELRHSGVLVGYLICVDTAGNLRNRPERDFVLMEAVLAKQLIFEYHRSQIISNDAEEVLINLLTGRYESEAAFQIQASATFLAELDAERIALVDMEPGETQAVRESALKAELCRAFYGSHPFMYDGEMILFLGPKHDTRLFDALAERFGLRVVISDPYGSLYNLPRAYANAKGVMEYIKERGRTRIAKVGHYRELLILRQLENSRELMHPAVRELEAYDRRHGTDYCRTLLSYILHHHSLQDTCISLNLHRNTVLYRVNKLKYDFGIDLDDMTESLGLIISAAMAVYAQDEAQFIKKDA